MYCTHPNQINGKITTNQEASQILGFLYYVKYNEFAYITKILNFICNCGMLVC